MKRLSDAAILDTVQEEQCNTRYGSPYRAIAQAQLEDTVRQIVARLESKLDYGDNMSISGFIEELVQELIGGK